MNESANFSNIHKFYDLINSLLTFGFDKSWRRQAAANLKPGNVLDLGSGTGASYKDLKRFDVVALDPDENMLSLNKFQNKETSYDKLVLRLIPKNYPIVDEKSIYKTFLNSSCFVASLSDSKAMQLEKSFFTL